MRRSFKQPEKDRGETAAYARKSATFSCRFFPQALPCFTLNHVLLNVVNMSPQNGATCSCHHPVYPPQCLSQSLPTAGDAQQPVVKHAVRHAPRKRR